MRAKKSAPEGRTWNCTCLVKRRLRAGFHGSGVDQRHRTPAQMSGGPAIQGSERLDS